MISYSSAWSNLSFTQLHALSWWDWSWSSWAALGYVVECTQHAKSQKTALSKKISIAEKGLKLKKKKGVHRRTVECINAKFDWMNSWKIKLTNIKRQLSVILVSSVFIPYLIFHFTPCPRPQNSPPSPVPQHLTLIYFVFPFSGNSPFGLMGLQLICAGWLADRQV